MLCSGPTACHDLEHRGLDALGYVGCLTLKKLHDPDLYDRVHCNRLRGRDAEAVTEEEVQEAMKWFLPY
jgi:hypothetical protein